MINRVKLLTIFCLLAGIVVIADSFRRRTLAEKVDDAELIIHGVATLEGLPLEKTERPVKRSCRITVLQTLWPTNQPVTNTLIVTHWAWTNWPDTWWHHNSRTGVYFFERTTTAVKRVRADYARRDPKGLIKIDDNFLGANAWAQLNRFDDWYEPVTNITAVRQLIWKAKAERLPSKER